MQPVTSCRLQADESPSHAVITNIAEQEGIDPLDMSPPLYDVLDPEALDRLLEPRYDGTARPDVDVTFTYRGYTVTVDDSTVTIESQ